jgi:uncharacterized membrane protein YdcZ (DUF606 family)
MVLNIIIGTLAAAYITFNFVVSNRMDIKAMTAKFITGQNVVGKIATNIFYAPAWVLKGLKFLAVKLIK